MQWADFDDDGALDLALANNPSGHHYLWRNLLLSDRARRSLQVLVLDERGRYTKAGSEVRVYAHFDLPTKENVDVEVTTMTRDGRKIARVARVDANKLVRRTLVLNIEVNGSAKTLHGS